MAPYLLDYRDCIMDWRRYNYEGGFGEWETPPSDPPSFFRRTGWCPFCEADAASVFTAQYYDVPPFDMQSERSVEAWACDRCGWWQVREHEILFSAYEGHEENERKWNAIAKRFSLEDLRLPLEHLRHELSDRPRLLHLIHPRKLEELVGAVLGDFFDCDVEHCGRSHDGGIDLVLVQAESPVLIQVKRRQRRARVETVAAVREFLGAMLLKQGAEAIFVTTADHFSSTARQAADAAVRLNLVRRFDLVDFGKFLELIKVTRSEAPQYWRGHLPPQGDWITERMPGYGGR